LKNQKRKMLVPIALAVSAALAFGATAASAKAGSGAVKAAAKCATPLNTALDKKDGVGAGWLARAIACGNTNPMKATGSAVKIGFLNPEGPVINFPEYRISAEAAVAYINKELGGIGADPATGKAGVPIKLEICKYNALVPAELGNCANTLASKKPAVVFASLAFGDAHVKIFQDTKTPLIVGTPIFPADFTSPGVYAIGAGGGCLGVHLGLIYFATQTLKLDKIALPWAASAPGIFCFNDLEAKPLDILAGKTRSGAAITTTSKLKGTMPTLTYLPISVPTSNPDVAGYAAQIMAFKPNVLAYSNQGNLCWDLMNELIKLGWTKDSFKIVFSGSCIDTATMLKLGDKITGLYTIGGLSILDPDALTGAAKSDALTYGTKMYTYSKDRKLTGTGFATQGFSAMMTLWAIASESVKAGKVTGAAMVTTLKATNGHRAFGSTGLFCKQAIKPYIAVCATQVSASQWDGTALKAVKTAQSFSGLKLVGAGDALRTSEVK
jgi:branched-chain amino acid transport system substrate-binding protein